MINKHKSIELFGRPLFSWIDIYTPMSGSLSIPSEACFSYFMQENVKVISKQYCVSVKSKHIVLSVSGDLLSNKLANQKKGIVKSIIVHLHPETLKKVYKETKPPFWKELSRPVSQNIIQLAASNLIQHYIEGIKQLFDNRQVLTEGILILKLKEIILLLLQTDNLPEVTQIIRSLFSERTFDFKETVEAHLYEHTSIPDLASLTNTSISTFKRKFTKIYKDTPHRYILNRRIEKVASILRVSDDAIGSIAYDCGFSTPTQLSRLFKIKYNKTPSQYRLECLLETSN
ncbi:helix-turn-helix transcriptional regulator [Kordia sp. YSTF-M3]|uniref:Helix-turn-helix transcriptional regulator n=1 Tax=Kordia aestuariivivens TaxID=2759037 RepID=A0ABR7QBL8_9FLAO|nr:AraC family transcriptional regulator [Kordia aestuariivivens]MBC8755967.1 helix-turn-helix transcriptional regulator [Kordia aestuariivivens]